MSVWLIGGVVYLVLGIIFSLAWIKRNTSLSSTKVGYQVRLFIFLTLFWPIVAGLLAAYGFFYWIIDIALV